LDKQVKDIEEAVAVLVAAVNKLKPSIYETRGFLEV
jgi:hypothetical protein